MPPKKYDEDVVEKLLIKQREAFEASMRTCMFIYDEKLEKLTDKFNELKVSLEFSQDEIERVKSSCKQYAVVENSVKNIESQIKDLLKDIDYIDNQTRKNNVRIDGIPETLNEDSTKTEDLVLKSLSDALDLSETEISEFKVERAYRVNSTVERRLRRDDGANQRPPCRPVFVKFASSKKRDFVLKEFKSRKPAGIYANEDFSPRVLQKRKDLLPEMYQKRREGKIAFLSYDRLIIREPRVGGQ